MRFYRYVVIVLQFAICSTTAAGGRENCGEEITKKFWRETFQDNAKRLREHETDSDGKSYRRRRAKNIIVLVGDGMGISTITAARIFNGQRLDKVRNMEDVQCGAEYAFEFERVMPFSGMSKTYNLDFQSPDSASTASAMFSGHKTGHYQLNDGDNCDNRHETIAEYAKGLGKRVGLVTTTHIMHATPAALYACERVRWHTPNITKQFEHAIKSRSIDVALGGGSDFFKNTDFQGLGAVRVDAKQVRERAIPDRSKPIVGDLSGEEMPFIDERTNHPSLEQMAEFALDVVAEDNSKGFFLMIEAGRIDQAHHKNFAQRALLEMAEFDRTVKVVYDELVRREILDDTLIILTADHSHQFVLGSYSSMGQSLFDPLPMKQWKTGSWTQSNSNFLPRYPTAPWLPVSYVTGPGGNWTDIEDEARQNLTHAVDYSVPAFIETKSATHSGEDVAIFARGPQAHQVTGSHEQSDIFFMMKAAFDFDELAATQKRMDEMVEEILDNPKVWTPERLAKLSAANSDLAIKKSDNSNTILIVIVFAQVLLIILAVFGFLVMRRRLTQLQRNARHRDKIDSKELEAYGAPSSQTSSPGR